MTERLRPKRETLRELYLKSGNLCAFPGCGARTMDANGDFSDQLCHLKWHEQMVGFGTTTIQAQWLKLGRVAAG